MSFTTSPYLCFFAITHGANGWSEAWHLPETDLVAARNTVLDLATARSYLLADGNYLEWAAVRSTVSPYIEWAAIGFPMPGLPQWGESDNDYTGLLYRFQTNNGRYANHLLKAIEDDEISNEQWIRKPFNVPHGAYALPVLPTLATKDQLWRYVLTMFRERTCHARKVAPNDPLNPWWELTPWEDVIFRGVSSNAWGSKYRRVSWEPREYTEQPGFTPCGTAVSVLRSCYEQDCQFFSAGPVQGIRYYNADPAAGVFPFPTIFWGWRRDKAIPDGTAPGERKAVGTFGYSLGLSWGVAPGVAPDGTPAQFLGQTVCPWGSSPTTPGPYIVPCDMPSPVPITVDDDPLVTAVLDVTHLTFGGPGLAVSQLAPHHAQVSLFGVPSGSGTTNVVPRWTSSTALGDSTATDDGTTLGLLGRFATPRITQDILSSPVLLLDPGDAVMLELTTGLLSVEIDGISGEEDGRWLILWLDNAPYTFKDNDAGPPSAQRIFTESGVDVTCYPGSMVFLNWSAGLGAWRLHSVQEASQAQPGIVALGNQSLGTGEKYLDRLGVGWNTAIPAAPGWAAVAYPSVYIFDPQGPLLTLEGTNPGAAPAILLQGDGGAFCVIQVGVDGINRIYAQADGLGNNLHLQLDTAGGARLNLVNPGPIPAKYAVRGVNGIDANVTADGITFQFLGGILTYVSASNVIVTLSAIEVEAALLAPTVTQAQVVTLSAIEVEATLLPVTITQGQAVVLSAIEVEATLLALTVTVGTVITLSAIEVEATLLAPTVTQVQTVALSALEVVALLGDIDVTVGTVITLSAIEVEATLLAPTVTVPAVPGSSCASAGLLVLDVPTGDFTLPSAGDEMWWYWVATSTDTFHVAVTYDTFFCAGTQYKGGDCPTPTIDHALAFGSPPDTINQTFTATVGDVIRVRVTNAFNTPTFNITLGSGA